MDINELRDLEAQLRQELKQRWDRALPFGEKIADRWERARFLGFGQGSSIYDSSCVYGDVKVSQGTWIGPFVILDGSGGGLSIGSHCSISAGVHVYTHDSVRWALSGGKAAYEQAPVAIGDCCHIGAQVVIARGVKIGHHCVVGANSFVKSDLPDFSIAVGSPARIIGKVVIRDDGRIELTYT